MWYASINDVGNMSRTMISCYTVTHQHASHFARTVRTSTLVRTRTLYLCRSPARLLNFIHRSFYLNVLFASFGILSVTPYCMGKDEVLLHVPVLGLRHLCTALSLYQAYVSHAYSFAAYVLEVLKSVGDQFD